MTNPSSAGNYQTVSNFSDKYLRVFLDASPESNPEEGFADYCFSIGFEMDCGEAFMDKYSNRAFNDAAYLQRIINDINDIDLLGSGIFSYWRYVTHWSYSCSFNDENRKWMILALCRLKELSTGKEQLLCGDHYADAIFFHLPDEKYGFLSNWYLSTFEIDDTSFTSCEQYIMFEKCKMFGDMNTANAILSIEDPKKHQALGRTAKGFVGKVWEGTRQLVLRKGLMAKFSQNNDLLSKLLDTGDAILVEAANSDKIWACGKGMSNEERKDISKWDGSNILGFTLMEVRDFIRA